VPNISSNRVDSDRQQVNAGPIQPVDRFSKVKEQQQVRIDQEERFGASGIAAHIERPDDLEAARAPEKVVDLGRRVAPDP